jgi:hypothetical protein
MSPSAKLDRGAFPEYFPDETRTLLKQPQRHYWFAAFFAFGAMMCLLTTVLLVFPGTKLDSLWNLNPDAHVGFQSLGSWSIVLLVVVGAGCALAAIGLWRATNWGRAAGGSDSILQHHWRSSECIHAPRLSITRWSADRRSNDLLPGPPQHRRKRN